MPRSRQLPKRAAITAALFVSILWSAARPRAATAAGGGRRSTKSYHLELEAYPAAPFPYFSKFGTIDVHVYPAGVRAESFWLSGFSRKGTKTITVMNPVARMYTDMPLTQITKMVSEASPNDPLAENAPPIEGPIAGKVGTLKASRYRLMYGPTSWIDVWTTTEVPENAQLRSIVDSLVRGISPPTANVTSRLPGTPVYVELNFRRFRKLPFLKLKKLTWSSSGEADALKVGSYYIRAPLIDAVWR